MKKRVLMVSCGGLGNGGVQAIMMGIIRSLHSEYHFDMLVFTKEKRHYDDEFLSYGGKIFRLPHYEGRSRRLKSLDGIIRDNRIYKGLVKVLSREQPYDIVHCNKEYESGPILEAAKRYNVPIRICHTHVYHGPVNPVKRFINKRRLDKIERCATHLIGCSDQACSSIYRKSYHLFNNFYDDGRFKFLLGSMPDKLVLCQVGSINPNKNQLFSVKVIKAFLRRGLDAKLKLIGFEMDKNYKRSIEEYISENELEDTVEFLPGNSDIPGELADSSCFIMPSFSEGFPVSSIEAQAVGLHGFVSRAVPDKANCGGLDYLNLEDGADYWADRIYEWRMSADGKKHAYDVSKYALSKVMEQYRSLYGGKVESTL